MKYLSNLHGLFICALFSTIIAQAWTIEVTNKTERILEAQGEMVAVIGERKHTDWKRLNPGESATFKTEARLVKGVKIRLPEDMKKYNYPSSNELLLQESKAVGMAINAHYLISYVVTPDNNGGSTETFFLLRIPNILLSRPGGIVNESKPVYFGANVPPIPFDDKQTVNGFDRWEGSDAISYDQAHYLMAHNAHTSTKYGFTLDPQQDLTITELMKYGLRGFMLDSYLLHNEIVLLHGGAKITELLLKPLQKPDLLKTRMDEIIKFMKTYPKVVITISFEDYVGKDVALFDQLLQPYEDLIFTPSDYKDQKNQWPTLGWMRSNNKRLVLFKSKSDQSKYIFSNEWAYHIENQYSKTDKKDLAAERSESKRYTNTKRTLYFFNFFGTFNERDYELTKKGYKSTLKEAIDYVIENGLEGKFKGLKPNFIAIDFAERGEGLGIVHDWNQERLSSAPAKPA